MGLASIVTNIVDRKNGPGLLRSPKTAGNPAIQPTDWWRFPHVKQAKKKKPRRNGPPLKRAGQQGQPLADELIPDDAAVIMLAQFPAAALTGPNAQSESSQHDHQVLPDGKLVEQQIKWNGGQAADGTRCNWGQTATETRGNQTVGSGQCKASKVTHESVDIRFDPGAVIDPWCLLL